MRAIVYLEPVFKGKRFDEVVSDNVTGVFWNPDESRKIGFTQNYAEIVPKILPAFALESTLPYNIGLGRVASGDSSMALDRIKVDSRIMIPFGFYISRNLEHLLTTSAPNSKLCFDTQCVENSKVSMPSAVVATVRFTKTSVSEDKPNRLTLIVEGDVVIQGVTDARKQVQLRHEIVERHIASEGYRHSDFLRVMDKMANEISSVIASQIITSAL